MFHCSMCQDLEFMKILISKRYATEKSNGENKQRIKYINNGRYDENFLDSALYVMCPNVAE